MKRYIIALASCLLLACSLALCAPVVGAHAVAGNISGVVVNGAHQNVAVVGQKVTLQRSTGATTQDIATTTTGSAGQFSFGSLPINASDTSVTYAVYTQFQGGMFSSQTVSLGDSAATNLQLKVYDTTNDDTNLRVTVATLLVRQPRPVNGLIGLGEIVSIENTGTRAFVGTPTGDASKPMRLLRFATPPNASNLSLGIGFSGAQIITTDKGFGATATVLPGTTDFAFAIDIPYTGTAADLSYKAVYPTTRIVALVSPDMFVNGEDFQAQGLVDSLGARYQVFTVANATAGRQVALQLTGLPQAGEKNYLDARTLMILAAILALVALLALAFYLRRGNIAPALGLVPAPALTDGSSAASQTVNPSDTEAGERDRLLHELLALGQAHTSGAVSDAAFRQRDRALRLHIRALLANESATVSAVQEAAATTGESTGNTTGEVATVRTPAAETEQPDDMARQEAASEQSSGGRR